MSEEQRKSDSLLQTNVPVAIFFVALSILLMTIVVASLRWRMVHDGPIMMYTAMLINRFGLVPYRDFFDMNMPGAHLFYAIIGRCFGYGDLGFRLADLCALAGLLALTWMFLRRFGVLVAWFASVVYALLYLREGPMMSLQRESLLLLPIIGALCAATALTKTGGTVKAIMAGLLFGIAATLKPHSAIGFPFVLLFQVIATRHEAPGEDGPNMSAGKVVLAGCVAFCLPIAVMVVYLWRQGALSTFIEIATNYWPLYGELDAGHRPVTGRTRIGYLVHSYVLLGGYQLWLIPAAAGLYHALFRCRLDPLRKRLVTLVALLAFAYSIYPAISGQFWKYHWLIFAYLMVVLSAFCFIPHPDGTTGKRRFLPALVACAVVLVMVDAPHGCKPYFDFADAVPWEGRPDAIAEFLRNHLEEGDTVQPLDWAVGGAVHGMLMAEAKVATPFIYAFHFYHHVSHDYIQELRRRFIKAFEGAKPRYVVQYTGEEGWVSGNDTTRQFDELDDILREHYVVQAEFGTCLIYERSAPVGPGP